jgi:hypothetical protein
MKIEELGYSILITLLKKYSVDFISGKRASRLRLSSQRLRRPETTLFSRFQCSISSIKHPVSNIQYRVSSTEHQVSSIKHRATSNDEV